MAGHIVHDQGVMDRCILALYPFKEVHAMLSTSTTTGTLCSTIPRHQTRPTSSRLVVTPLLSLLREAEMVIVR